MDGFNITKAPSEFVLQENTLENFISQQERAKHVEVMPENSLEDVDAMLYILPSAFEELNEHIQWKMRTPENIFEQGGILVGSVYKDRSSHSVCGVVRHIITSKKSGNITYIQFTHDDWISMYKEFEDKYSVFENGEQSLKVIGWYHTHPNMPVKMSGIDKSTHTGFFPDFWQFSVIFNPQRGIWSVFNGKECKNCDGILFCPHQDDNMAIQTGNEIDINHERVEPEHSLKSSSGNTFTIINSHQHSIAAKGNCPGNQIQERYYPGRGNNKISMIQLYRGEKQLIGKTCYYYPLNINRSEDSKKYMISDALVRILASFKGDWEFRGDEAFALIYYCNLAKHYAGEFQQFKDVTFIEGIEDFSVCGFIFSSEKEGLLEYVDFCLSDKSAIAVVYSYRNPGYQKLSEMCNNCDYVVWINPDNLNEFEFYVFDANTKGRQKDFNIKTRNCNSNDVAYSKEIRIEGLKNQIMKYKDEYNLINHCYYIGSVNCGSLYEKRLWINEKVLKSFFEKIIKYRKFSEDFYIIVSYRVATELCYQSSNNVILEPYAGNLLQIWVLKKRSGNVQSIHLRNLIGNNQKSYSGEKRCAYIISNKDISKSDISSGVFRNKLEGHCAVLCLNIETQSCRLF